MRYTKATRGGHLAATTRHFTWFVAGTLVVALLGAAGWYLWNTRPATLQDIGESPAKSQGQVIARAPKGSYVLVESKEGTATYFARSADNQEAVLFSTITSKDKPKGGEISPDGKLIVFTDEGDNVISQNLVSGDAKVLVQAGTKNDLGEALSFYRVKFSPDGQTLALYWLAGRSGGIALIDADGKNFRDLKAARAGNDIAWSADGKQIAITVERDPFGHSRAHLYVASAAAPEEVKDILPQEAQQAGKRVAKNVYEPSFSPDSAMVAVSYATGDDGTADGAAHSPTREIYTIRTDGSNFTALTRHSQYATNPLWVDNKTIVYGLNRTSAQENGIYRIDLDGSQPAQLYTNPKEDQYYLETISPDRARMVFATYSAAAGDVLLVRYFYLYLFEGGDVTQIADSQPEIFPDRTVERQIGFVGWVK